MRTPVDWAALLGTSNAAETTMDKAASALVSAAAVLTAAITGAQHGPQRPTTAAWYGLLRKPAYTPPGALIGGAWGGLEVLLGVTG